MKSPNFAARVVETNFSGKQTPMLAKEKSARGYRKGSAAVSALGPPNWENSAAKHREVLDIPRDPLETRRMLLKTENDVNARLHDFSAALCARSR
jgi:hypothetical protein